jgi:hypothetical protein
MSGTINSRPCRLCGAAILFLPTAAGRQMPVNAASTTVMDAQGHMHTGHVPHWSTCPHADKFRRPKTANELPRGIKYQTPTETK